MEGVCTVEGTAAAMAVALGADMVVAMGAITVEAMEA